MKKKYDISVYIGRFQPFHNGHYSVVKKALEISEKLIIIVGSATASRSVYNPWYAKERTLMIQDSLTDSELERVEIRYQDDYTYNLDKWIAGIQSIVFQEMSKPWKAGPTKITLIGHSKDESSYYLKLFPTWDSTDVHQEHLVSSTDIREYYFTQTVSGDGMIDKVVSEYVSRSLSKWRDTDEYKNLKEEYDHLVRYKLQFRNLTYAPTFNTVDAVVVQSGHVLLVKRKSVPGKGLWALPGGFVNTFETVRDATIRELKEETKIDIPIPILKGSIYVDTKLYDDPWRSQRGRTITHATYFHLKESETLPKVKGSDDAEVAKWVPLSQLNPQEMFEDHYSIIHDLVNI